MWHSWMALSTRGLYMPNLLHRTSAEHVFMSCSPSLQYLAPAAVLCMRQTRFIFQFPLFAVTAKRLEEKKKRLCTIDSFLKQTAADAICKFCKQSIGLLYVCVSACRHCNCWQAGGLCVYFDLSGSSRCFGKLHSLLQATI